jgi:hypothetical protein
MNHINKCVLFHLLLALLLCANQKTYSQEVRNWGSPVFGAKLSLSTTNNVIPYGSTALFQCISTNSSTNGVCFTKTDPRWMFEISIIDASGKSTVLTGPQFAGDSSDRRYKINHDESYSCLVPVDFQKSKPGNYTIVASEHIVVLSDSDGHYINEGQLVSNTLDITIK